MFKQLFNIILILFLSFISTVFAQDRWSVKLNGDDIHDIAVEGMYVWCATDKGGLVRWDTANNVYQEFTTLDGLLSNTVHAVKVDRTGVVWIGTNKGVQSYDGYTWRTYSTTDGLGENDIRAIFVDSRNNKWFSNGWFGSKGVTRFDGNTWDVFNCEKYPLLGHDNVYCVAEAPDGAIWFGSGGGASRFDGKSWTLYRDEMEPIHYTVLSINFRGDGVAWFGGNFGVLRWEGNTRTHYNLVELLGYSDSFYQPLNNVKSILIDLKGILWFQTNGTLVFFDGEKWSQNLGTYNSLSTQSMAMDTSGTIWLGTKTGLLRYDGVNPVKLSTFPAGIQSCAEDRDGTVWIGSYSGLYHMAGETWSRIDMPGELENDRVYSIAVDQNNIKWLVTSGEELAPDSTGSYRTKGKIASFVGKEWTIHEPMCGFDWVHRSVTVDRDNVKWVCGSEGLWSYNGISWKHFVPGQNGMPETNIDTVYDVAVDKDNVKWISLYDCPPAWFDGNAWSVGPSISNSISLMNTRAITVDANNNKWFCSANNWVIQYDNNHWSRYDDIISSSDAIAVDSNSAVWVIEKTDIARYSGGFWEHLFPSGILDDDIVRKIFVDSQNTVWFALDGGLLKYEQKKMSLINDFSDMPKNFGELYNFPNPFNPSTTISFTLIAPGKVNLDIYTVSGQKVATLIGGPLNCGVHTAKFDGSRYASGIYFYRLTTDTFIKTAKMTLLK